ncbi:GH32 C-terminal domain-containing protein [Streptosporangium sp. NPDC050855]|uniref:GH32 C-terminal domain-containing protein n=1 Tax=Streptosporangium sp. NPDC050855 TaxID=3366194 RepID=UPI0037B398C4
MILHPRRAAAASVMIAGVLVAGPATHAVAHGGHSGHGGHDRPPRYDQPHRPQLHYSPAENWMNDPNGLVHHNGEYHLFYQYNPQGDVWGNISWGHAVSTDLVHWKELGVAIPATDDEKIFSGSVVVDRKNTAGFGRSAMVAIYTGWNPTTGVQSQSLAHSTDNGRTWTKYDGNPVIDLASKDFRDPKVFWYAKGGHWVMSVAMAADQKIRFYRSADLKSWTKLSDFGPANATGGAWECPDLFQVPVEGRPGAKKWVLAVSVGAGAIAGGSGVQYFVGDFDGTTFTADNLVTGDPPPAGQVFADFENGYDGWTVRNDPGHLPGPFGDAPAPGTLPGQNTVSGYQGAALVNGFVGGDAPQGSMTSRPFTIGQGYINLLVGGGRHPHREGTGDGTAPAGDTIADFEFPGDATYEEGGWTATGGLAGQKPARGSLPGQSPVIGYQGDRLASTFYDVDTTTGTLTSPEFTLTRNHLNLLVGGGDHPWGSAAPTAVNLLVDGQVARTATGADSETLNWTSWDVSSLTGKKARIQIVDENPGGWGHLMVDQVMASDRPVLPRATETAVNLLVDGKVVRTATGEDSESLDWASWDVRDLAGRTATIQVNDLNSGGWGHINLDHIMFSDRPALSSRNRYSWADYGKDFYAAITFDGAPGREPVWLGWMNNWEYAQTVPTAPWRGAQSLPRTLTLRKADGRFHLVQRPVRELRSLRTGPVRVVRNRTVTDATAHLPVTGTTMEINAEFALGTAERFGLVVRANGDKEGTRIGYDRSTGRLYVDRTASGDNSAGPTFPGVHAGPVQTRDGKVSFTLYLDNSSVEVFGADGRTTITDQIFPGPASTGMKIFADNGTATLLSLKAWPLRSAWR